MPDNHYQPYDPGQSGPPPGQRPQEKLILGSFNQPQNPPPNPSQGRPYPYNGENQQAYGNVSNVNPGVYTPPRTPAQPAYNPQQGRQGDKINSRQRPRRRKNGCAIGCLATLVILLILGIISFNTLQRVNAFGSAISKKAPFSTETNYMTTSDRTNLLVISTGGGSHDGANLTDSLVVISMIPSNQHTSLVSVPRDLWVQNPPDSGYYSKINAVYAVASDNGKDQDKGADALAKKISSVTGMDVQRWMMIDFNGFREFIDSIGGVDVAVPNGFSADYPKNDDPKVDASWIRVEFKKGKQHMNGEQAIRYARARYNTSNPAEGTDFARSARQQLIIRAALSKLQNMNSLPQMFSAMDALQKAIRTNYSLIDLGLFSKKMNLNDPKTGYIGLNYENVMAIQDIDGQSVVVPRNNDWEGIKTYVKENLYN